MMVGGGGGGGGGETLAGRLCCGGLCDTVASTAGSVHMCHGATGWCVYVYEQTPLQ